MSFVVDYVAIDQWRENEREFEAAEQALEFADMIRADGGMAWVYDAGGEPVGE